MHPICPDPHGSTLIKKQRPSDNPTLFLPPSFSLATFDPATGKINGVSIPPSNLLCSGVSMRRSAFKVCNDRQIALPGLACKKQSCQFEDITIEHTKCKPLSVTLAVEKTNRKILALHVSSMPATGHLAAISRKKYGLRADDRLQGIETVLRKVAAISSPQTKITSDEHPFYPLKVKTFFPQGLYTRVKGKRGCVAGQGELKKVKHDPLFSLNHTCAMFRANVNRLFRRTWCTTKCPKALLDHLIIYMHFHNAYLTP